MTVCESCKQLTEGLGKYCMSCKEELEKMVAIYGPNRQCQECGGYEYDDGTCDLCYCYDEED